MCCKRVSSGLTLDQVLDIATSVRCDYGGCRILWCQSPDPVNSGSLLLSQTHPMVVAESQQHWTVRPCCHGGNGYTSAGV
jgi:hypothetical protein